MPSKPIIANRVEVQIEGLPEDGGAVRLEALYNFLAEVKRTLTAVEREVTSSERSALAYKIVTLTYNSPVRVVLEPILAKRAARNLGNIVTKRFVRDVEAINSGRAQIRTNKAPSGIEPATAEQFERLVTHRKQAAKISVGSENQPLAITADFDERLRKLLGNVYKSRGSFRGRLEAVNIHSSPCVLYIYPVIGPSRVRCVYPKGRFPRIGEYLATAVDVTGILKFRGDEPHPYEIEIEDIDALRPNAELIADSLVGSMPDLTQGQDIQTYLRELRHE